MYGSGRFCSRVCANSRIRTQDTKDKISASLMGHPAANKHVYTKYCVVCSNVFEVPGRKKNRVTCTDNCSKIRRIQVMSDRGKHSATKQQRRSKNEIEFANLCVERFTEVLINKPMFNGWDADVILPLHKVAVLWNGPWHYVKLTEKHSLEQVQTRDRHKIKEINACGFKEYIIKDMGSHNPAFVLEEFEKFKRWIS